MKKELVANRQLSMVNIIYRLYILSQPGGIRDQTVEGLEAFDQGVQMVCRGCRLPVREELQVCPCGIAWTGSGELREPGAQEGGVSGPGPPGQGGAGGQAASGGGDAMCWGWRSSKRPGCRRLARQARTGWWSWRTDEVAMQMTEGHTFICQEATQVIVPLGLICRIEHASRGPLPEVPTEVALRLVEELEEFNKGLLRRAMASEGKKERRVTGRAGAVR